MLDALPSHLESPVACVQFLLQPLWAGREEDLCDSKESIISLFPKSNADLLLKMTSKLV